jgi:uncharacterized membrane protein YgdD (TMEM256/DUF423 family)
MAQKITVLAGCLGALAVALGAFGAHGLQGYLAALEDGAKRMEWWEKAVDYQLAHSLLLVMIGLLAARSPSRIWWMATAAVTAGVFFFSGGLYVMTLSGMRWLGMITPLGGLSYIAAWAFVSWGAKVAFSSAAPLPAQGEERSSLP